MTRTVITATQLSAGAANPAVSQSTDATNGHSIAFPNGTLGQSKGASWALALRVVNSAGADKNVIVRANTGVPSGSYYAPFHPQAAKGDLTIQCAASSATPQYIVALDSSRYVQDDGTVSIDYESGFTGTIEAYIWPIAAG